MPFRCEVLVHVICYVIYVKLMVADSKNIVGELLNELVALK